jgi:hypothetical protein
MYMQRKGRTPETFALYFLRRGAVFIRTGTPGGSFKRARILPGKNGYARIWRCAGNTCNFRYIRLANHTQIPAANRQFYLECNIVIMSLNCSITQALKDNAISYPETAVSYRKQWAFVQYVKNDLPMPVVVCNFV